MRWPWPALGCCTRENNNKNNNNNNKVINQLALWRRILLEKLKIPKLVKKFPAFYGTRSFITVFTRAHQLSLLWARSIQSAHSRAISWRYIWFISEERTTVCHRILGSLTSDMKINFKYLDSEFADEFVIRCLKYLTSRVALSHLSWHSVYRLYAGDVTCWNKMFDGKLYSEDVWLWFGEVTEWMRFVVFLRSLYSKYRYSISIRPLTLS